MSQRSTRVAAAQITTSLVRRAVALAALAAVVLLLTACHVPAGAREHALCCPCPPPCAAPPEPPKAPLEPREVFEHHYGVGGASLAGVPHTVVRPEEAALPEAWVGWPAPAPAQTSDFYFGGGGSLLPNVGVSLHAGWVFARCRSVEWAVEVEGLWQFLDDEAFADDGNPSAGDWYQVKVGALARFSPRSRRHLTLRGGFTWFRATGEPNIVEQAGDYFGVYGGIGFDTDLSPWVSMGPELSVAVTEGPGKFKDGVVPQFAWRLTYRPGCGYTHARGRLPLGEVYLGAAAIVSPTIGGGIELGQVFHRDSLAVWSFEMLAGAQPLSTALWGEGDGDWAQLRGGVKAAFAPCSRGHVTGRLGLAWFRNTATTAFVAPPGDRFGGYAGIGYEYDLTERLSTGPELSLLLGAQEGTSDFTVTPQLLWHFLVKL